MAVSVSLSDIAEASGVSRATVSKALNGWPDVSVDTRRRILRAARRLNYPLEQLRPGRKPKSARIRRIGLVCFDYSRDELLAHMPYQRLIAGIEEEAATANDELITEFGVSELPRCYLDMRVDAIVVVGRPPAVAVNDLKGLPVVCTPNHVPGAHCDFVLQDSKGGAELVTQLLIDQGHRQIAFVSHSQNVGPFVDRREGYEQAVRQADLQPLIITDERDLAVANCSGDLAARLQGSNVTAVVAGNDRCAKALILILGRTGIQVPKDMSIVGFDYEMLPSPLWPGPELTTIDGNTRQVGREVIRLLSQLRFGEDRSPLQVSVTPKLVKGETVAPPATGGTDHHHGDTDANSPSIGTV